MKTILLVAAESREFAGVRRLLRRPVRLQWPVDCSWSAEWNGEQVLLVANGPGPHLAGEALDVARSRESFDAVISTGFCGALDPALAPGDIFVASTVEAAERALSHTVLAPDTRRRYASGTLVSGDRVIQTAEEKRSLRAGGGDAVDMEAAAAAERASEWRLPFFCVRVVTDAADEGFACDFNAARDRDGRFSRWKMLLAACRRPGARLPELWRLRRRSREAAVCLGDFLADCRF